MVFFVYYESIKRELKIRPIYECRCDERLKTKAKKVLGDDSCETMYMYRRYSQSPLDFGTPGGMDLKGNFSTSKTSKVRSHWWILIPKVKRGGPRDLYLRPETWRVYFYLHLSFFSKCCDQDGGRTGEGFFTRSNTTHCDTWISSIFISLSLITLTPYTFLPPLALAFSVIIK